MPNLIHKVSRGDFNKADKKFNELFNGGEWYGPNNFMRFIGLQDFRYYGGDVHIICSEPALRKIEILNSPHAYALMKAFIVRTGYHKKLVEKNHDKNPV